MLHSIMDFYKKNKFLTILVSITFVFITITAIYFKANPFKTLPLFISLVIMVLQARVNRYAFLLGSINSLIYCYYYVSAGLYTSLAYAVLISFPLQLISFFNWKKKSRGSITELKKMSGKELVVFLAVLVLSWAAICAVALFFNPDLRKLDTIASMVPTIITVILDTTISIIGIAATILTMIRFSEYAFLQLVSGILTITLHFMVLYKGVLVGDYSNITYIVFSIYSFICVTLAIIRMYRSKSGIIANLNSKEKNTKKRTT